MTPEQRLMELEEVMTANDVEMQHLQTLNDEMLNALKLALPHLLPGSLAFSVVTDVIAEADGPPPVRSNPDPEYEYEDRYEAQFFPPRSRDE